MNSLAPLLVAAALVVGAGKGAPVKRRAAATPGEIVERMKSSKVVYRLEELDESARERTSFAEEFWAPKVRAIDAPKVGAKKDGRIEVTPWKDPRSTQKLRAAGAAAMAEQDFKGASGALRKAVELAKDDYLSAVLLGDALLAAGDGAGARAAYDTAIERNPFDHRSWLARANAHRHAGRNAETAADLRRALALRPRDPVVQAAIAEWGDFGFHLDARPFAPVGLVTREGREIAVYTDPTRLEWFAWTQCKALWFGDPEWRRERVGPSTQSFTTEEELECLAALLVVYEKEKKERRKRPDPQLERLSAIFAGGHGEAFVVYELASRVDPQIVLKLPPPVLDAVERYVAEYVLVDAAKRRAAAAAATGDEPSPTDEEPGDHEAGSRFKRAR